MTRVFWAAALVLLAALAAFIVNGYSSSDAEAQTSAAPSLVQSALLQAGGRTIGGPGVEVVGLPRVFDGGRVIFDTCLRDAGGVPTDCRPLDICITFVNRGSRPVTVGFNGPTDDALVSLSRVAPERAQTSCATNVASVDLDPVTDETDDGFGRVAVPTELHWRIDLMPDSSGL